MHKTTRTQKAHYIIEKFPQALESSPRENPELIKEILKAMLKNKMYGRNRPKHYPMHENAIVKIIERVQAIRLAATKD